MNIAEFVALQKDFSARTFGPGPRTKGLIEHIAKELIEIQRSPYDIMEWADIIILGLDGAWRSGHTPQEVEEALRAKLHKNMRHMWPDWREQGDGAIQHIKDADTD